MRLSKLSRDVHRWGAILIAAPLLVVIATGVMLQLKKELSWIQPPTQEGTGHEPSLTFDEILTATRSVSEAEVTSWEDIDRLDVRPAKGMLKVRCRNRWEIQLDCHTGEVIQVAFRRSDLIESIHDGSFFHDLAKLWVFLPAVLVLCALWATGMYLFFLPHYAKWKRRRKKALSARHDPLLTTTMSR